MLHIKAERNLFSRFHRQLFCWIDEWHGLSMIDIRRIEDEVKKELDQVKLNKAFFFISKRLIFYSYVKQIQEGQVKGHSVEADE